jgi:hypothetical protein
LRVTIIDEHWRSTGTESVGLLRGGEIGPTDVTDTRLP